MKVILNGVQTPSGVAMARKRLLQGGAALGTVLALSVSATAYAQDAATDSAEPTQTAQQERASATNSALMGDIVVTARKREERTQDVPIAISAFSGEALEARSVVDASALADFTPNLTFQNNAGFGGGANVAAIFIRGIGQADFLGSIEPGVGLYIDGVYIARSVGAVLDLVDVERIEVLRGPQGTLFGRNTIGGAVSVTSQQPNLLETEGTASVLYGSDNRIEVRGSVSTPVTETLAVKLSGAIFKQDGYVRNETLGVDLGDNETFVGRAQLRWEPSDRFRASFSFDYTDDRSENGAPSVLAQADTDSNIFNPNRRTLLPPGPPLSPFFLENGGTPVGGGFEGRIDPSLVGLLPPGVDPNTIFYQLNVAAARPPNGSPPGTPANPAFGGPLDAPTDNFALLFNYLQAFGPGGTPGVCISEPFAPYFSESDDPSCFSDRFLGSANGGFTSFAGTPGSSKSEIFGGSLNLEYDITDTIQIVSITGYREINSTFNRDGDNTPFPIAETSDIFNQSQFSQELQLKGQALDGRLDFILGGYYFDETVDNINDVRFTPIAVRSGGSIQNESIAAFGQATFEITPALSLTAGIRWTKDDKVFDATQTQFIQQSFVGPGIAFGFDGCGFVETAADCPVGADTDGVPQTGPLTIFGARVSELSSERWTPAATLSYKVTDDILTYASYSEGFKSGGFTQRVFPPLETIPTVDEETVRVYEVGFKSSLFDRRVRLNGAAFRTEYSDLQIQGFTPETGVAPVYFNAGSAVIEGFELDAAMTLFDALFVEASVGYLNPRYTELAPAIINSAGIGLDNKFERISDWTAAASAQYDIFLSGNSGIVRPRVDWSYRSEQFFNAANTFRQPGYSLFNGSLTYISGDDDLRITLGVNNIADKYYFASGVVNDGFAADAGVPDRGRQFYIRTQFDF